MTDVDMKMRRDLAVRAAVIALEPEVFNALVEYANALRARIGSES